MENKYRNVYCGEVTKEYVNKENNEQIEYDSIEKAKK